MKRPLAILQRLTLVLAAGAASTAYAAPSYFSWQTVELPTATGASCSDGSPYRFFVNRTPFSNKTVVVFEGGGACWDQDSCTTSSLLGASNPNGIPADYMSSPIAQLMTPMTSRLSLLGTVQTQQWNIVYMPYCTGDVHTGNKVGVYSEIDPDNPKVYHHRGALNTEAAAAWLKENLPQPKHLLVTGASAGGAGATANYAVVRNSLNPKASGLMADSGPLYSAPRSASSDQYPSLHLHNKIRDVWGLDGDEGLLTKMQAQFPGLLDADDLGSATTALAKAFPADRFGYALFQGDGIYSDFSYTRFYPEIQATKGDDKLLLLNEKWTQDISNWIPLLQEHENVGYYMPYYRDLLLSHTLTLVTFNGTAIKEANQKNIARFIDNIIEGQGTPMRAFETQPVRQKGLSFLDSIINLFLLPSDK